MQIDAHKLTNWRESQLPTYHLGFSVVPQCVTDGAPNSVDADFHSSFSVIQSSSQADLAISAVWWNYIKPIKEKKKEENGVHIPEWVIQQLHTQTPHSNIFTVLAAVDSNPTIWAAEKRGLGSSASNIIQEDSTTATAKVGIAESWSTCSGAVENNWVEARDR